MAVPSMVGVHDSLQPPERKSVEISHIAIRPNNCNQPIATTSQPIKSHGVVSHLSGKRDGAPEEPEGLHEVGRDPPLHQRGGQDAHSNLARNLDEKKEHRMKLRIYSG